LPNDISVVARQHGRGVRTRRGLKMNAASVEHAAPAAPPRHNIAQAANVATSGDSLRMPTAALALAPVLSWRVGDVASFAHSGGLISLFRGSTQAGNWAGSAGA